MTEVYINGKYTGTCDNASAFVENVKNERRKGGITNTLNIYHDDLQDEVNIEISRGRTRRPLIVVKDGMPQLTDKHIKQLQREEITWNDLIRTGAVEYLDASEEENALVAFEEKELTPEHTHLEISSITI